MSFLWIYVILNGSPVDFDSQHKPYVQNAITMVPLRIFMEKAGATVNRDTGSPNTTVKYKNKTIMFSKYSSSVIVNGEAPKHVVYNIQTDGTRYVPLRFLTQEMGATLSYDASTRTASITLPKNTD